MRSLATPAAIAVSCLLVAQAAGYYLMPRTERSFATRPLKEFPTQVGPWRMEAEFPMEPEVQAVLKSDDSLNRAYVANGRPGGVNLFVAFFKSQTTGVAPHSPKNCMPGAGWAPLSSSIISVPMPSGEPIPVNRYLVSKGDSRTLVLYWYQTPMRIVASEFAAKFWLVADSMRYRRSDTSLVRVSVPLGDIPVEKADQEAIAFVQALLPELNRHLPRL